MKWRVPSKKKLEARAALVAVAVAALALSGCASSGVGGGSTSGKKEIPTVSIAFQNTSGFFLVKVADGQGFFKDAGVNVKFQPVTSGNQQVSLLLNDQIQMGGAGPAEILVAISEGIPLEVLTVGTRIQADPAKTTRAIVVSPDSGITSTVQLSGKKVAVSNLFNSPHVDAMGAVDAKGGDQSKISWVAIPGGQQWSSIKSGAISAAVMKEPDLTPALLAGAKIISVPEADSGNDLGFLYFLTKSYVDHNPTVVAALQTGLAKAADFVNAHPEASQQQTAKDAGLSADVASKLRAETTVTNITSDALKPMASLLAKFKITNSAVSTGGLVIKK